MHPDAPSTRSVGVAPPTQESVGESSPEKARFTKSDLQSDTRKAVGELGWNMHGRLDYGPNQPQSEYIQRRIDLVVGKTPYEAITLSINYKLSAKLKSKNKSKKKSIKKIWNF